MATLVTHKQDNKLEYYIRAAKIDGKHRQICKGGLTMQALINTLADLTMNEIKEITDLIDYLDNTSVDIRYKAFFALILDIGVRRGEAIALRWSEIEGGSIHIRQACGTILGACEWYKPLPTMALDRALQIGDYTQAVLDELKQCQNEQAKALGHLWHDTDLIFTTRDGQQLNPSVPYQWLRLQRQKDSMTPISVAALRNMYASVISALISFSGSHSEVAGLNNVCTSLCNYAQAYKQQIISSNGANHSLIDIVRNNNPKTAKEG